VGLNGSVEGASCHAFARFPDTANDVSFVNPTTGVSPFRFQLRPVKVYDMP
jgi:hypothetical protein